jgi:hypothetical protein
MAGSFGNLALTGVSAMTNREQRGNREKRKLKAEKPKSSIQILPFARGSTGNKRG